MRDKIRGAVLAQALGDALGAPFEFAPLPAGDSWIETLHPFAGPVGPHGPWQSPAPAGAGTDDVRYNWLFMELVVELGRAPTAAELARRLLEVHERPEAFFAAEQAELARAQFALWQGVSCGYLGRESALYPGVPPQVLATRSVGLNYPTIAGLLLLPSAGLLFAGEPEAAYGAAYEMAFFDVGYAREAVALLAAAQSLALAGESPEQVVEKALALEPLQLGGPFGGPFVRETLPRLLEGAKGKGERQLALWLSAELRCFGVFDPCRALAIAFAALLAHADEPLLALQVAANQRDLGGAARRYADIDCYAGITGALVGAACGETALPAPMRRQVVEANRRVYGFDLEDTLARFATLAAGAA